MLIQFYWTPTWLCRRTAEQIVQISRPMTGCTSIIQRTFCGYCCGFCSHWKLTQHFLNFCSAENIAENSQTPKIKRQWQTELQTSLPHHSFTTHRSHSPWPLTMIMMDHDVFHPLQYILGISPPWDESFCTIKMFPMAPSTLFPTAVILFIVNERERQREERERIFWWWEMLKRILYLM